MFDLEDVYNIEGNAETEEDYFVSLQKAINSGSAWRLQGSYGRAMMEAIEVGKCVLGRAAFNDFYGNRIPSRNEIQEGTKGSIEFVRNNNGNEWAEMIAAV